MRTIASGLSILALVAGIAMGCSDSGTGRVSDNPREPRSPSASPPTTAPDTSARTQGGATTDSTAAPAPVPPPAVSPSDRATSR